MRVIEITTEYITLGQLVKYLNLINNGGEARNFIINSNILVQNEAENRRGRKIYPGYLVIINGNEYLVGTKN